MVSPEKRPEYPKDKLEYAYPITRLFYGIAEEEGATERPPSPGDIHEWEKGKNLCESFFDTPSSGNEFFIGLGISFARSAVTIRHYLQMVHRNCPPSTQNLFPFDLLPTNKPRTLHQKRLHSQIKGGTSAYIADEIAKGRTPKEILESSIIKGGQLSGARQLLKTWGIDVPRIRKVPHEVAVIESNLQNSELPDDALREILEGCSLDFLEKSPNAVSAREIAKAAGVSITAHQVATILENAGVPFKKFRKDRPGNNHTRYFYPKARWEQAIQTLKQAIEQI